MEQSQSTSATADNKRKRSPADNPQSRPAPPRAPAGAPGSGLISINYLARLNPDKIPLVTDSDSMLRVLGLIDEYEGVLMRNESMAANLGATLMGQLLFRRLEKIFDGPIKILQNNGKENTVITWLDVADVAAERPQDFQLVPGRRDERVCQFWTRQCKVEISEEDFMLINSGIVGKIMPAQPDPEDEEKELVTIDILEKSLLEVIQKADASK